jgi:hypothetical protein
MTSARLTAAPAWFAPRRGFGAPPEAIEEPPITTEAAARLIGDLGFVAFRTPPDADLPDSCLMAVLHKVPTRRHFDPELVS